MTIREAAYKWVQEFNAIPTQVVWKLMLHYETEFLEITPFAEDDQPDDVIPMWGCMWQMTDFTDTEWIANNIDTLYKCGFRIFESEDFDYLIGIDGAGYDFYEEHWIPLYKERGLKWHDQ